MDELTGIVEVALDEYNNTHKNRMNLVIFRYLLLLMYTFYMYTMYRYTGTCLLYMYVLVHIYCMYIDYKQLRVKHSCTVIANSSHYLSFSLLQICS